MAWKHIFWNDDFIVTNKDDWVDSLAGKVFANVQFEVFCAMDNWKEWPRFYYGRAWDFRLKDIFLQILEVVKKGAREGPSAGNNSPRIHSIIIAEGKKPHISIMMFDKNEKPILEIPESADDLQYFADISHMT